MLKLTSMSRKNLVDIAQADRDADANDVANFVAAMEVAGLYGDATEDEIERLDDMLEEK